MAQIEPFERPYNIVYGEDGGKQSVVNFEEGPDLPQYKARRMITAILFDNVQKLPQGEPEREDLEKIRRTFHEASGGDLVFGKIMRWINRKGRTRFIGIVEKGQDYTTAGQTRQQRDPNYVAPPREEVRHYTTASERLQDADRAVRGRPVATGREKRQTEAERIADKMAKASRQAVEGDR